MNMIKTVSDENAAVEIDAVPLGAVVRVQETEIWSEHSVFGFGDGEPTAVLKYDRHYRIELYRDDAVSDAVPDSDFTLSINGREYTGCCRTGLERTKNADGTVTEHITVYAAKRQEVQDG